MHITEKQLKLITEVVTRETLRIYEEKLKEEQHQRRDRRLKNIKLLLRHYRNFKKHCEDIKLEIDELNERLMFVTVDSEEFKLKSIQKSKEKTLIMVRYIERMLVAFKSLCEMSENKDDIRQYETIYYLYISDDKKTVEEIAKCQNVTKRTVYRDVDRACKTLATLMFGIDGLRFD